MKRSTYLSILCCLLLIPLISTALGDNKSKAHKKGDREFYRERFESALTFFEQEKKDRPDNHDAIYKAEICSLLTKYGDKPMELLLSYEPTIGKNDKFYNYWLGRIHYRRHEFDLARVRWEAFLKSRTSKSPVIIEETRDFINKSKKAEKHQLNPNRFVVMRLEDHINTADAEIAPVMVNNDSMLLFAAKSQNSTKRKEQYNIFYSTYDAQGWSKPQGYTNEEVRLSGGTSLQLLNDGSTLFFNSVKKRSDIFYIDKDSEEWSSMNSLARKINKYGNDVTFYITDDMDYIIFASNRYTNYGDMDLFESYRIDENNWAKPIPLNIEVNSPYDELSPYLSEDEDRLFFSSKGHESLGGFDVFVSEFQEKDSTWSKAVNLGYPINSVEDDLYFQIASDEKTGFLSSNRYDSKGSMDLYFFYIPEVEVEGTIAWDDKLPVEGATISFKSKEDDLSSQVRKSDGLGEYNTILSAGQTYDVVINYEGKEFHHSELNIPTSRVKLESLNKNYVLTKEKAEEDLALKRLQLLSEIIAKLEFPDIDHIHEDHRSEYPILNSYVYFGFDQDAIVGDSEVTLSVYSEVLKTHDDLVVDIEGHADHIGTEEYNLDLSMRRSQHVVDYFLSHGISESRLRSSHHGESKLFLDETHHEARKVNRRVELTLTHINQE